MNKVAIVGVADGIDLLDEYDAHPSIRKWVDDGYEIITF